MNWVLHTILGDTGKPPLLRPEISSARFHGFDVGFGAFLLIVAAAACALLPKATPGAGEKIGGMAALRAGLSAGQFTADSAEVAEKALQLGNEIAASCSTPHPVSERVRRKLRPQFTLHQDRKDREWP